MKGIRDTSCKLISKMQRTQSAKSSSRLHSVQSQHKAFTSMLKTIAPSAQWGSQVCRSEPDLLLQLRRYRMKDKIVPPLASTSNFSALKKGILLTSREPQLSSKRGDSSPTKHVSIVQTARTIEAFPPVDPKIPYAVQDEANERLYRGSRVDVSPRPETLRNPLFRFADIVDEGNVTTVRNEQIDREKQTHARFIQSLKVLKNLVFELELNYEAAHAETSKDSEEPSQLGAYYLLLEELNADNATTTDELLKQTRSTFAARLTNYTKMIRTMIRDMRRKGLENECVMMELMWKLIVKMFDSAMELHDFTLSEMIEITKGRVREEIERRRRELEAAQQRWDQREKELQDMLQRAKQDIKFLESERSHLSHELSRQQDELAKLTDVRLRESAVEDMHSLYRRMCTYLQDSELEQTKQAAALDSVEVILNAARKLQPRPILKSVAVETDDR